MNNINRVHIVDAIQYLEEYTLHHGLGYLCFRMDKLVQVVLHVLHAQVDLVVILCVLYFHYVF
jgi:hypothetical protein